MLDVPEWALRLLGMRFFNRCLSCRRETHPKSQSSTSSSISSSSSTSLNTAVDDTFIRIELFTDWKGKLCLRIHNRHPVEWLSGQLGGKSKRIQFHPNVFILPPTRSSTMVWCILPSLGLLARCINSQRCLRLELHLANSQLVVIHVTVSTKPYQVDEKRIRPGTLSRFISRANYSSKVILVYFWVGSEPPDRNAETCWRQPFLVPLERREHIVFKLPFIE